MLSANCQGLGDAKKRIDVLTHFRESRANILCLQDTHWTEKIDKSLKRDWKDDIFYSGLKTNARGVAILIKQNFEYKVLSNYSDNSGNLIVVDIKINTNTFKIINIYAPNTDNPNFFENILKIIDNSQSDYFILCGDYNLTLNPTLDSYNYKTINNPLSRNVLLSALTSRNMIDYFRHFNPTTTRYTWRRRNPLKQSRLDYIIGPNALLDFIQACSIIPGYRSDHSFVEINLRFCDFIRGKGTWKLNCSLLKDKQYLIKINELINQEKIDYAAKVYNPVNINKISDNDLQLTIDDSLFLEHLLAKIRGETIKYSSQIKKKRITKLHEIKSKIESLEQTTNPDDLESLAKYQNELIKMRAEDIEGIRIRSRAEWLIDGEKPSKYLSALEKKQCIDKTIKKLKKDDGTIITDQESILHEIEKYYQQLFMKDSTTNINTLNHLKQLQNFKKLSDHQATKLDLDLTIEELGKSLKKMKNGKSPGIDGFPCEFFKVFWDKLKYFILKAIKDIFNKNEMPHSLKQCLITCIPKGDKDRQNLKKNWRPISLLPTLYKIISSAIASRIKSVLPHIISKTQTGFLEGRSITENTRLIYDLMHYTEIKNIPGLLMLVDFQKAFDSVSWNFLNKVLNLFNFGENIIKWINIFNTNISAYVSQYGTLTKKISIQKGCRQGDPLSSYLFLICAQIMYLMLDSNEQLKGIQVNQDEVKLTQFADDTTLILDGSCGSLQAALNTLEVFGNLSGLKINTDKTQIVWIGKKRGSKEKLNVPCKLIWGATHFKILGIQMSTNLNSVVDINYNNIIEKLGNSLESWKKRYLTTYGKITVVKTFIISKFIHLFTSIPNPDKSILNKINNMIFKFIWDGKPDKIKRSTIISNPMEGGLKMIDLPSFVTALKLSWVRQFLIQENSQWKNLVNGTLFNIKKFLEMGTLWHQNLKPKISNPFWHDIFSSWIEFQHKYKATSKESAACTPLWNNPKISTTAIFNSNLYKNGCTYIADLCDTKYQIYDIPTIRRTYKTTPNFLEYLRMTKGLNNYLITLPENNRNIKPIQPLFTSLMNKYKKGSRIFYNTLIKKDHLEAPNFKFKWSSQLSKSFTDSDWKKFFNICHYTIHDNDLKWFQYKIIHKILGTNSLLFKISISTSNLCRACNEFEETDDHLFFTCRISATLIDELCILIHNITGIQLSPTLTEVLLGKLDNTKTTSTYNIIFLIFKHYLFRTITTNTTPSLDGFLQKLKRIHNEQEYIAKIKSNIENFNKKWSVISSIIQTI